MNLIIEIIGIMVGFVCNGEICALSIVCALSITRQVNNNQIVNILALSAFYCRRQDIATIRFYTSAFTSPCQIGLSY